MGKYNSLIRFLRNGKYADQRFDALKRKADEILYANRFHDSIKGCSWLAKDGIAITPGGGAIGYNFLLAAFRILDYAKPKRILEIGMGQSTRLIRQYVMANDATQISHIIVEHDRNFIDFCSQAYSIKNNNVLNLELIKEELPIGSKKYSYHYKDFCDKLKDEKFDFIVVDGPFGMGDPAYSRIDILGIIPACLEQDFCIMFDDYDRDGEKDTVERLKEIMSKSNIKYYECKLSGEKDIYVMASESNKYLLYF